ncbi:MAG: nicotinamide-nucleotide amidohydrolase family protein, partial [Candidatus Thermoplasmatota archaeon]|nr:nicotinamide-nucleotide amidohydrolase family protein [Candidatus Thermoplasmatota archaeon]
MLASDVGKILEQRSLTLAVAESCTGGRLGDAITDVPGSSAYFLGGVISYSNEAKFSLLGVDRSTLESMGAVSEKVALMMADGVRKRLGASIGVGITGISGPTGSTPDKPVGLVCIAVSSSERSFSSRSVFSGSRSDVKAQAVLKALE